MFTSYLNFTDLSIKQFFHFLEEEIRTYQMLHFKMDTRTLFSYVQQRAVFFFFYPFLFKFKFNN